MKKIILAAAIAATASVASAANVAFIKGVEPSTQENGALEYFQSAGLGNVLIANELENLSGYDCLWIHIDRIGQVQGWENLPSEFTSAVETLKEYVNNGGNLYLSGHATQLATALGRIGMAPNVYNSGNGGYGDDIWSVSATVDKEDHSNHPIYKGLEDTDAQTYLDFGLLWGGGTSILREDHNCLWNNYGTPGEFESKYQAKILGSWGQVTNGDSAGIVEFYPLSSKKGTIIANGLAACQWVVDNGTNAYKSNLEKLTSNIINYLVSEERDNPNVDVVLPEDITFEVPESSGKVAMLLNVANESELTFVEKGAVDLFRTLFPEAAVLCNEFSNLSEYDCVWVNIERDNINAGWENLGCSPEFIEALKVYVNNGGNLYLSKHAVQLAVAIGRTNAVLGEFSGTNPEDSKTRTDVWQTNVASNGLDWSCHSIFNGITIEDADYGKLITLLGEGTKHYDRNCMWKLAELGGHNQFCKDNNARVLGTWGHNGGQSFAGIVEFCPVKNSNAEVKRTVSKEVAEGRKGTIIANGLAAYHIAPFDNTVNPFQDNIDTLTKNIISYLSPVTDNGVGTGVESVNVADSETVYFNLQGVRVANPTNGLYIKVQNGKSSKVVVK